jgi:hypothetical protein
MLAHILGAAFAVTAGYDVYITAKILQANPDGELNPLVKWLEKQVGPHNAAVAGVLVPKLALISFCAMAHSILAFGVLTGMALDHAWKQFYCQKRGLI